MAFLCAFGCTAFLPASEALSQTAKASLASNSRSSIVSSKELSAPESAYQLNEDGVSLVLEGKREQGIARIRRALELDPVNTTAMYNLAGIYLADGKPAEASELMERAAELQPNDIGFLKRLAQCHFVQNDINKTIEIYERILALNPEKGDILLHLGTMYGIQQHWDRAEELLRKAYLNNPDDSRALSSFGSLLVVREKFDEALPLLTRAYEKEHSASNALALGFANAGAGRLKDALPLYLEAKRLGSTDAQLDSHIAALRKALDEEGEAAPQAAARASN